MVGAFVEGTGAAALALLADEAGGAALGAEVRTLLADHPPPAETDPDPTLVLIDTYKAQEHAALMIARGLDDEL